MATVIVSIATQPVAFPSGTVPSGIVISLSGGAVAPQTVTAAPYSGSFSDVAPGSYTASAQAIAADGSALGAAAVSAEFTIAAPVNVDIPQTVSVQVQ